VHGINLYICINLYISLSAKFRNLSQHLAPRFSLPRFCSRSRSLTPSSQWIEVEDIAALHRGYLREDFARIRASGVEPTLVVQLCIFTCTHSYFCLCIYLTIHLHIHVFSLFVYLYTYTYIYFPKFSFPKFRYSVAISKSSRQSRGNESL